MIFKNNAKYVNRLMNPHIHKANNKLDFSSKNIIDARDYKSELAPAITARVKNPDRSSGKAFVANKKPAKSDYPELTVGKYHPPKSGLAIKVAERENQKEVNSLHLVERLKQLEQENENVLEQLQVLDSKYQSLVSKIPAITYIASLENPGKLLHVSPQIDNLGYTADDWLQDNQGLFKYIHQDDLDCVIDAYQKASNYHTPFCCEYRITAKNGQIRWLRNSASVIRHEKNNIVFLHGILNDISKDKETEQELFYYRHRLDYLVAQRTQQLGKQYFILKSAQDNLVCELSKLHIEKSALISDKAHFQQLLDTMGEGVLEIDNEGCFTYANNVALGILGYTKKELSEQKLHKVFPASSGNALVVPAEQFGLYGESLCNMFPQQSTGIFQHKKGSTISVEYSIYPMRLDQKITGSVLIFREISMSLRYQATHDALTGVINRREFIRLAERVLASTRKDHSEHALCYLDFDHFKMINDTYGHAAGDDLLRTLMALIRSKLRSRDIVARLGGDEFALLFEHTSIDQAYSLANELCKNINEHCFIWEGKAVPLSVSIGLALLNRRARNITDVINAADKACLYSKEKGRNQVNIWQQETLKDYLVNSFPKLA